MLTNSRKLIKKIQIIVKQNRYYCFLVYILGIIYNAYLNLYKKPDKNKTIISHKKVIIIYSKLHYNPKEDSNKRKYALTSAGNLARNIYSSFSEIGSEIIYVDVNEPILNINDADIIFGIVSKSFIKYCKKNTKARKILFLVNSHPLFRLKELIKESSLRNVHIPWHEYSLPFISLKCMKISDKMIINTESDYIINTFNKYSDYNKIINSVNSGVNSSIITIDDSKLSNNKIRILFFATDLGLRKGFFRLIETWNTISKTELKDNIELIILGKNSDFNKELDMLMNNNKNIQYINWIDNSSIEFVHILQSSHIVLGLSLEEGQVGSILEAMSAGCIPIITRECGIPINKDEGYVMDKYDVNYIINIIDKLSNNRELVKNTRIKVNEYIKKNHNWKEFKIKIKNYIFN